MRFLFLLSLLLHTALSSYLGPCGIDSSVLDPNFLDTIESDSSEISSDIEGCVAVTTTSLHCDFKNNGKKYSISLPIDFKHVEISNTRNLTVFYDTCATVSCDFKNVMGIIFHPMILEWYNYGSPEACCSPVLINADNSLFNSVILSPQTTMVSNRVNITELVSMNSFDINGNSSTKIDQITLVAADRRGSLKSLYIGKLQEQMYASGSKRLDKLKETNNLELTDIEMNLINYNVFSHSMLSLKNSIIYKSNITVYTGGKVKLYNSIMFKGDVELRRDSIIEVEGDYYGPTNPFQVAKNHLELGNAPLYKITSFDQLPDSIRWYKKHKYLVYAPAWFQLKRYDKIQTPWTLGTPPLSTEELGQLCTMNEYETLICDLSTLENDKIQIYSEDILPLIANSSINDKVTFLNANEFLFRHSGEFSEKKMAFKNIKKLHLARSIRDENDSRSDFYALYLVNTSTPIIEGYFDNLYLLNKSNVDLFRHTATNNTRILNSEVNILNLETQNLFLKHSEIKTIDQIYLNKNGIISNCDISEMNSVFGTETSHLQITNVKINEIKREGLILLNKVTIKNSNITHLVEDSVLFDDVTKSVLENVSVVSSGNKPFKFLNFEIDWKSVFIHDKPYAPLHTQIPQEEVAKKMNYRKVPEYMTLMTVLMMGILTCVYFTCKMIYIVYCMCKPISKDYFYPPEADRR